MSDAPQRREPQADDAATTALPAPLARKGRRWWRRVKLAVRVCAVLVLGVLVLRGCDGLFYHPSRTVWVTPQELGLASEDVWFESASGARLHGWFLPAEGAPRGTLVHFHGNAENITNHLPLVEWLPRRGFSVLMFDYAGYGRSTGSPTRAGTVRDGHAALDYVLRRPDVDPARVGFYGQSLGGAVALVVAADRPEVRSLVIESSFGDYRGIAALHLRRLIPSTAVARWITNRLVSDGADPLDVIAQVAPRPLLVIAAGDDAVCFPELSRELFEAAREPKAYWVAPGAAHLGILDAAGSELERRVSDWFSRTLQPPSP